MTNEEAQIIIGNIPIEPEVIDDCYSIAKYQEAKAMAINALEQKGWIPCSERLPERDTDVLAYHKNVSFEYVYVSWIDDYTGKWAGFIGNLPDDVLAWMPLPEPWRGE